MQDFTILLLHKTVENLILERGGYVGLVSIDVDILTKDRNTFLSNLCGKNGYPVQYHESNLYKVTEIVPSVHRRLTAMILHD